MFEKLMFYVIAGSERGGIVIYLFCLFVLIFPTPQSLVPIPSHSAEVVFRLFHLNLNKQYCFPQNEIYPSRSLLGTERLLNLDLSFLYV